MSSNDGLLVRLRDRYRAATTPTDVERAPKRERRKRVAWMLTSNVIALAVAIAPLAVAIELGGRTFESVAIAVVVYVVFTWFVIDRRVFLWGFDRFDIIPPWQFREAAEQEFDEHDLTNIARRLEYVEDELHERDQLDHLRAEVTDARADLVDYVLEGEHGIERDGGSA